MVETAVFKIMYPHGSSIMWHWSYFADLKVDALVSHISFSCFSSIIYTFLCSTDQKIEFKDLGGCRLSSSSSSSGEEKGYAGGEEKGQWLVLRRKFMCKNQGIIFFFTVDQIISLIICCCSTQNSAFNIESKYQFP